MNHVSKQYLETAARIIPEMKGVVFTDEIKDCVDCKLAKGNHNLSERNDTGPPPRTL